MEFARKLGFSLAVNAEKDSLDKLVEETTGGLGAYACIEGTGAPEPWADCISLAKAGGRVVCLGNPLGGMSLSQDVYWKILRKELSTCKDKSAFADVLCTNLSGKVIQAIKQVGVDLL